MAPSRLPAGFRLVLDPGVRRPRPEVLIGGSPVRVIRLSGKGARVVDGWAAGRAVSGGSEATLATRLVDAGLAHPRPPALAGRQRPVAVVVPVRDDPDGLRDTLVAIGPTPGVALIVVDDGSAVPVTLPPGFAGGPLVVRRPVPGGPAAARNTGLGVAGPVEVVVFVDAGCRPAQGWLGTLTAHFADPGTGAVAGRVTTAVRPGTPAGLAAYERAHSPLDRGALEGPVRPGAAVAYVPSALLAVRRSALLVSPEGVEGFDESMRFGEDVDLVWRLHRAGWRVRYEPAASASHQARPTRRRWARQRFGYGTSAGPLARRHGSAVAPVVLSRWTAGTWALVAAGHPVLAAGVTAAMVVSVRAQAGQDPEVARELGALAVAANLRAGAALASAVRRAWLPPAALLAAAAWRLGGAAARRRLVVATTMVMAWPGLVDWIRRRPPVGPVRWLAWSLADDLAYQAGVWSGAARSRSLAALAPGR